MNELPPHDKRFAFTSIVLISTMAFFVDNPPVIIAGFTGIALAAVIWLRD